MRVHVWPLNRWMGGFAGTPYAESAWSRWPELSYHEVRRRYNDIQ